MERRKLKIGIDYHGVIDHQLEYFSEFCKEAIRRGHQIHVITGGPKSSVSDTLKQAKIKYSYIFAIVDYYAAKNSVSYLTNGDFYIDNILWNKAKGEYCRQEGIDIHIDDSKEYIKWFTTPYCLYNNQKQVCYYNGSTKIDFSSDVSNVLNVIETLCS